MGAWKLKGCPRCGGDVFIDRDEEHTWYEMCLQCSYLRELKTIAEFSEKPERAKKKPELVRARRGRTSKD